MGRFAACLAFGLLACSGSSTTTVTGPPADISGSYTVDVTDQSANACNISGWTQGSSSAGIPVEVTQNGALATATVTGIVGAAMQLSIGTSSFSGNVAGTVATLSVMGSKLDSQGNCMFTTNATLVAEFTGDTMQGTVTYTRATDGSSDCAGLVGCQNVQQFSGARPPSGD